MAPNRTIEPQGAIFAQRVRERHLISAAGSDLARMVLAKHAVFNRGRSDFPALIYHQLTDLPSEIEGPRQKDVALETQRASVQSTFANAAAARPGVIPVRAMIQRRSLSGGLPAGGLFTTEPRAILRSPVLSESLSFESSLAPVSLSGTGRFSASHAESRGFGPSTPTPSAAHVLFLPRASSKRRLPPAAFSKSNGPSTIRSNGRPVENREGSPPLFLSRPPAVPIRNDADEDEVGQPASIRSRAALTPVSGAIAAKTSANKPALVPAVKMFGPRSEAFIRFATLRPPMLSEVHPWRAEAFSPEIPWQDIRINPLGRSLPGEKEIPSAAVLSAPSLELTLELPNVSSLPEPTASAAAPTPRSLVESHEVTAGSTNNDMRPAVEPQVLSVPEVADKVYRLLERRLLIERERRGVFQS